MSGNRIQRLRDPVHGLITFNENDLVDRLAWRLLQTPEFQRLRRIKQLGVSEFIYPSATHSRFAHCVGVFHTARKLIEVIRREMDRNGKIADWNQDKADVAVIAALLHDLGHGPFSHTFEGVQRLRGKKKAHEDWTAEIVRNKNGGLWPVLSAFGVDGQFGEKVAIIFDLEAPSDIYHAVVSSSFDADRLDYLRRDKMMTGTGAGAIDFDWLMEHVRVGEIEIDPADEIEDDHPVKVSTFCLDQKALPAAEQFLLARYTLHEQVYFHKATRCMEKMIGLLLKRVSDVSGDGGASSLTGLPKTHPLLCFFRANGEIIENYLRLDDVVVFGAIEMMTRAEDQQIKSLAIRLRNRDLYKTLDIAQFGTDLGTQIKNSRKIENKMKAHFDDGTAIKDDGAAINIYTQIGGDDDLAHKKLHILDAGTPTEITKLSKVVEALSGKKSFTRYYFDTEALRDTAKNIGRRNHGT
jgi:uncharacterized protein